MGHAGVEGGVTRALMMHSWEGIVQGAIAQPQLDFTSEVVDTNAYTDVRGKASNVDVRMAERYPSKVGGDDAAGDEASRVDFAARRASERREAYLQAQRLRASGAPGKDVNEAAGVGPQEMLVLLPEKERAAWSYLVRTEDPLSGQRVAEERSMPAEVAELILAENQRLQTLRRTHRTRTASARRPCARAASRRPPAPSATSTCRARSPPRTRGTRRSGPSTPRATGPTRRRRARAPASRRPRWS